MKRKVLSIILVLFIAALVTSLKDSARVRLGIEPKYTIKTISYHGDKVTYWGLGYKVIRYVNVSSNESFENNIGVKYGSWFMKYELEDENDNKLNDEKRYFLGKVIEADQKTIVVEPNDDEEIRKLSDKIAIGLGENNDMIYVVGTYVKITYDGTIKETYPAQINAIKIELKSAEEFEILFYDRHPMESYKTYTILGKAETNMYDYTIYGYDGSVNIRIEGKDYSLKDALLQSKITMDEIIAKANQDEKDGKVKIEMYKDGGSIEYHYENYTIIKCHTISGNRDVYIGTKDLKLTDVI